MAAHDVEVSSPEAAADALAKPLTEEHQAAAAAAPPAAAPAPPAAAPAPPRLARGVELIGEFEDSGFKKPPFIVRRADGQVVQMHQMLYRLAEQIDGRAAGEEIAERFSHAIARKVAADDVAMLIDQQLRPLGIVAPPDGDEPAKLDKVDPLLALKFRVSVVPDRAVRALTTVFKPLYLPPVMVLVVAGLLGLDGWLFFVHGISQSVRHTLYQPALMLMLIGGVVLATAFHEVGHATACRYGGARPGVMGVGIYIVWPAFYTDITDAYRLGKWGRLRTDIGGMYFNAIFALLVAGLYAVTRFEPLLLLVLLQNFAIIQQALPLLRLDGYYILSDLTGVPDIFLRIRAVLLSLIPGRPADDRVKELKSWVRAVVSAYVLFIVLFLGVTVVGLVINLPRIASTGYDSAALRLQAVGPAFSHGKTERGVLDVIQMLFLVLPTAGLAFTAARVGRRAGSGTLRWSSGHAGRQVALGLAGAGAIALAAFSWWPNGQYRPVQAGERGTLTGLVREVAALPTGRPSLTVQRERQLGGAPLESQHTSLGSAGGAGHSGQPGQPPAGKPGGQGADHNASNGIASGSGSGAEQTTTTSSGGSSAGQSGSGSPAGGSTTPSSSVGAGGGAGVTTPTDSTSTTTTTSASPGGSSPTSTQ